MTPTIILMPESKPGIKPFSEFKVGEVLTWSGHGVRPIGVKVNDHTILWLRMTNGSCGTCEIVNATTTYTDPRVVELKVEL